MTLNRSNPEAIDVLLTRRSVKKADMVGPGPDDRAMERILAAGLRVPDHGRLTPWRFFVYSGDALLELAEAVGKIHINEEPNATEAQRSKIAGFVTSAPALVIVASTPSDAKPVPKWEQQLSAGASAMSMLIAAHMQGYVGQWLTDWPAFSPGFKAYLGLGAEDQIAGFVFLGSQSETPPERLRPVMSDVVRFFKTREDVTSMASKRG